MAEFLDRALAEFLLSDLSEIVEIRRDLHAHPQGAFEEEHASGVVQRELEAAGVPFLAGVAGTGVVGWIEPESGNDRGAIALRADLDALPIEETSGVAHASVNPGWMHACGHDGHTAVLLGAARLIALLRGRLMRPVKLIFQPAEETGGGAEKMVAAGALDERVGGISVDRIYGLHGWPGIAVGTIATRPGPLMASTDVFRIKVHGEGGHGSSPEATVDPIYASSQIISAVQSIVSRNVAPQTPAVISVASIHAGEAENVIPDAAEMAGTIRALDDSVARDLRTRLRIVSEGVAASLGATAVVNVKHGCPVTSNDPGATEILLDAMRAAPAPDRTHVLESPVMASEDFSCYGKKIPACFFFLGTEPPGRRRGPGLHTPGYDFNDDAIPAGIEAFVRLVFHGV